MVGTLGPEANARAVVQPKPAALGLLVGNLQPLPSPDPLHALGVHRPAGLAQQGRDPPIAVAAIGLGQLDDVGGQGRLVVTTSGRLALRGTVLSEHRAGAALGHLQPVPHLGDAGPATGGA